VQTPREFSPGRMMQTKQPEATDRLLHHLSSPAMVQVLRESGLEP
jgi:hypothetical protein